MKRRRRYGRIIGQHGDGVFTHPTQVSGTISRARGRIYKGPQVVLPKLKQGAMTKLAIKHGYIKEGERVSDIPNSEMDDFARSLVKSVGHNRAMGMVNAQIVLRKNQRNGFKTKMLIAKDAIKRKNKVLIVQRR